MLELLNEQRQRFARGEASGAEVAGADTKDDAAPAADELAAWTIVARVLLNLDETITKE